MPVAALHQDRGAIGERQSGARILLDEDDRHAAVADVGEPCEHHLDQFRRQTRGWFVEHQRLWTHEHRARDCQHLPLAAGKSSGGQAALAREIGKGLVQSRRSGRAQRLRQDTGGELQIVVDAHARRRRSPSAA